VIGRFGLAGRLSVWMLAATLGTTAAIAVLGAVVGSRSLEQTMRGSLLQLARGYADSISGYVNGAEALLEATAPGAVEGDLGSAHLLARRVLSASRSFEYVELVDAGGRILFVEPASLSAHLTRVDLGFAAWFQQVRDRRRVVVSDLVVSLATQRPSVDIAIPLIGSDGGFRGAWVGGLELGQLSTFERRQENTATSAYGYLTDSRGLIVAHQARPDSVLAQTDYSAVPPVREALKGREGTILYVSPIDGLPKVGAYLPILAGRERGDLPWAVGFAISTVAAFRPVRLVTWTLVGFAVLLGAALAFLGTMTIRRALRPVGLLADAAREMQMGNLSARAPAGMRYELADLAGAFNRMAAAVQLSQERLTARAQELEESTAHLQAANRELEAFSYSVSHDLRAPLRSIDGFSKAILEDYEHLLDAEGKEYLRFLRQSAQKMGVLIDDLLTLSRATRAELVQEDVDLSGAAREIAGELAGRDPPRRVRFEVDAGLSARGDARLLRSVLENLLENAWKFTRGCDPALIEVRGDGQAEGASHFFVRDNGVGFDMRYVGKLFQPFQRLHRAEDFEGTGIGLASVKRILARHGGQAWASSQPGGGTTIHFTIGNGNGRRE